MVCSYPFNPRGENVPGSEDGQGPIESRESDPGLYPSSLAPAQVMQQPYQHVPQPGLIGEPDMLDLDFWNPNVLSAINWLDGTPDQAFDGLNFLDYQLPQVSNGFDRAPDEQQIQQPSAFDVPTIQSRSTGAAIRIGDLVGGESSPSASRSIGGGTPATQDESVATEPGEYYVDGEPARRPRTKRRKLSQKISTPFPGSSYRSTLNLASPVQGEPEIAKWTTIDFAAYQQMQVAHSKICEQTPPRRRPFEQSAFPSKQNLEHLLALYTKTFHESLPFLHLATLKDSNPHWLLLLAMAACGAHFLESTEAHHFVIAITELVDRLLNAEAEESMPSLDGQGTAQIELLHIVNLAYSGSSAFTTRSRDLRPKLADRYKSLASAVQHGQPLARAQGTDWREWVEVETMKRTAFCIWMVDCMCDFQFGMQPRLTLQDTNMPLPCAERLWAASSSEEWRTLFSNATDSPTLPHALQQLYIDKKLPSDRGEFARILTIHGLFHRQWEVGRYLSDPLSQWTPTATKQSSTEIVQSDETIWLPSLPTFTRWQNSACDCLDILHWQANATIGKASGLEHPTVMHLHLARIVLLSPYDHLQKLAKLKLLPQRNHWQEQDLREHEQHVQRWARQCQYKARLAAIHAGVVLWHVRRYSIDAFYEPSAVGLAALMLWAFGTYSPASKKHQGPYNRNSQGTQASAGSAHNGPATAAATSPLHSDTEDDPGIILLDRPTDDELVQQFVRVGGTMQARLNGVPDLYAAKGPERVLLEGAKILRLLKCWGSAGSWLEILAPLAECCAGERKGRVG